MHIQHAMRLEKEGLENNSTLVFNKSLNLL